jgi:hypothetical protein
LIPPSTKGFALLDSDGRIFHIERTSDPKEARRAMVTDFASYDLTPMELGGKSYWLTTKNVAESRNGNEVRHFESEITNCRLFRAKSTILATVPPDDATSTELKPHR